MMRAGTGVDRRYPPPCEALPAPKVTTAGTSVTGGELPYSSCDRQ